MTNLNMVEALL